MVRTGHYVAISNRHCPQEPVTLIRLEFMRNVYLLSDNSVNVIEAKMIHLGRLATRTWSFGSDITLPLATDFAKQSLPN